MKAKRTVQLVGLFLGVTVLAACQKSNTLGASGQGSGQGGSASLASRQLAVGDPVPVDGGPLPPVVDGGTGTPLPGDGTVTPGDGTVGTPEVDDNDTDTDTKDTDTDTDTDTNDKEGDICIGHGIKVSSANLVSCDAASVPASNKKNSCILICVNGQTSKVPFDQGRDILGKGSSAVQGACVP